ncbi:MAG: alpha/beta fold hydrolase [Sphingobacteriaceae bacterium]
MKIYFLSGLGADKRAFERIKLPPGYDMCHIPWRKLKGNETINEYARQLSKEINNTEPFMLAGLSFGGIMATEISKFIKPQRLILFSTVKTRKELPLLYRLAGKLKLYKVLPVVLLPLLLPFFYWFFGPLDKAGRRLVSAFLKETDPVLLKWSLGKISCWQNIELIESCLHIHGNRDRAFPVRLTKPDYTIIGGGHFCVLTHAAEINQILLKELS